MTGVHLGRLHQRNLLDAAADVVDQSATLSRPPSPDSEGWHAWLDSIKRGYGIKFARAFEEIGLDEVADLERMDAETRTELEGALRSAGAKPF